jgi:hypothetical protein
VDFDPNAAFAQITGQLIDIGRAAVQELAEAERENVSAGPRSGIHHPGQPRQSSAPGEFSQEQAGGMRARVEAWDEGGEHRAGIRDATAQDFTQELGSSTVVSRANLQRTALEESTIKRINAAVARETT